MATSKTVPPEQPEESPTRARDERDLDDDFTFSSPLEDKPKTAQEQYRALVENGFIGAWKDRTDMGDTLEYARLLRERAHQHLRGR
jgi:hypothetical protein